MTKHLEKGTTKIQQIIMYNIKKTKNMVSTIIIIAIIVGLIWDWRITAKVIGIIFLILIALTLFCTGAFDGIIRTILSDWKGIVIVGIIAYVIYRKKKNS